MLRVLLADDHDEFREWLRSLLQASGEFRFVGEASTGTEAIRLAGFLKPDLVIADICMPDQNGFQVARHLKRHLPGIKVILASTDDEPVYARLAKAEGALAFMPKARLDRNALRLALLQAG